MPSPISRFLAVAVIATTGCFSEQSFRLRSHELVRLKDQDFSPGAVRTVRPWLRAAHAKLSSLLPSGPRALLSEDLVRPDGKAADVLGHFDFKRHELDSLFANFWGLQQSAQATGPDSSTMTSLRVWPGYEEIWIPVTKKLSLCGYLGMAERGGQTPDADCIVILPGLFGDNSALRTRDLAAGLRSAGFHVLGLEFRGHGKTQAKYPDVAYTFGVMETGDLMAVSEWLQGRPHIRRTGLVGFCWGANEALMAAWYDGHPGDHPSISERQRAFMRPVGAARHFEAGVMAFSPVLRFEEIIATMRTPQAFTVHPVISSLQTTVLNRMLLKKYPVPSGSLGHLIDEEFAHSELSYPGSVEDAIRALRFLPYEGKPDDEKLLCARVPTLIVQAANDPLACAQDVADLMAKIPNPNLGAVVMAGGGHVGFAAYAKRYYFSLIVNFFDAATGPKAVDWKSAAVAAPAAAS